MNDDELISRKDIETPDDNFITVLDIDENGVVKSIKNIPIRHVDKM